jgi:hypothetical protein
LGVLCGRLGTKTLEKYTGDSVAPKLKAKIEEAAATVKPSKYDGVREEKKVTAPPPPVQKAQAPKVKNT